MLKQEWRKESAIDVINLVLGAGLISTPWIFGFTSVELATRNAWVAGGMIAVAAAIALFSFADWEEWVNLLVGLWVAISPWALSVHLTMGEDAIRSQVALGLAVAVLAAVELWMVHRAPPRITT